MSSKRFGSRIAPSISVGALLLACGAAQAQYATTFEAPTYNSSVGIGVLMTTGFGGGGQDGWYLPNAASNDGYCITYTGNTWNLATNPSGGAQAFAATPAAPNFGRAQHAVNFATANPVWEATFDCTGRFNGTALPASDNLASWSLQNPLFAATAFRGFQNLLNWGSGQIPGTTNYTATADKFHIGIGYYTDASPTTTLFALPGAAWGDLPVDHWYRYTIKWTFGNGGTIPPRILTCSIKDLTTNGPTTTAYVSNNGWFLQGGSTSTLPLPTDFRFFSGGGGAGTEAGGNVSSWDNVDIHQSTEGTGACCLPLGGCSFVDQTTCANAGGTYKGDGAACAGAGCPAPGACCLQDGTCAVVSSAQCATALGIYKGDSSVCGAGSGCVPFGFTGDDSTVVNEVGDMIATAAPVNGYGQPLKYVNGYWALGDRADIYKIQICDRTTFTATTLGTIDSEITIFDTTGKALVFCDDQGTGIGGTQTSSAALVTNQFIPSNGTYYFAVSQFHNTATAGPILPLDILGNPIFVEPRPGGTATSAGFPEWTPNGTSTTNILSTTFPAWNIDPDVQSSYTMSLTGACFLGCYPNCDGSTANPLLTANDFQCFLIKYAGGDGYANCDGSTANPLLTANDFQCFLIKYAGGCNP